MCATVYVLYIRNYILLCILTYTQSGRAVLGASPDANSSVNCVTHVSAKRETVNYVLHSENNKKVT